MSRSAVCSFLMGNAGTVVVRTARGSHVTPCSATIAWPPGFGFNATPTGGFRAEWFDHLNDRQKELMRRQKGLGHPHSSDYDEG